MKKIFCKKTLSAFLAAVMILAMIPVGMISAVAADAGYSIDEETKTITITTAAGWNAVANTEAYAAYNFVLGGNIDFSETDEDKPLFSSVAFAGTFDGGVYTISNFNAGTTSARVAYQGIIAGTTVESSITDSKIDTNSYIEIKNVTLVNAVFHSSANCGGLVGELKTYGKFENIKIENITISSGSGQYGWCGGMVGKMYQYALISAINCNVTTGTTGSISSGREAGGILALLTNEACLYNNATNMFKNCYVDANITTNNGSGRIGGIVGAWGRSSSNGVGKLLIDSCYAAGTYSNNDVENDRTAGIVGAWRKSTTTISNVVINVANLECAVCSYGDTNGKATLTLKNIYYTSTNRGNASDGRKIFQNGTGYTEGSADTKIESADVSTLVKMENGFIKGVAGTYGYVGDMEAQVSNVVDGKYIIRFVMPAMTADMTDVKMTIVVKNGEEIIHTYEIDCTMWDYLTGYNGRTGFDTYTPDQYGAEKLLAGAIVGVPTGAAYNFEISTTFTVNGVEIISTAYGASVTAQGALVTE